MYSSISSIKLSWIDQTEKQPINQIKLCKISHIPYTSTQPLVVTHTLLVNDDCTWKLYICGHEVRPITDGPLSTVPITLNQESFINLISIIDRCKVCPGNPDTHFIKLNWEIQEKVNLKHLMEKSKPELKKGFH